MLCVRSARSVLRESAFPAPATSFSVGRRRRASAARPRGDPAQGAGAHRPWLPGDCRGCRFQHVEAVRPGEAILHAAPRGELPRVAQAARKVREEIAADRHDYDRQFAKIQVRRGRTLGAIGLPGAHSCQRACGDTSPASSASLPPPASGKYLGSVENAPGRRRHRSVSRLQHREQLRSGRPVPTWKSARCRIRSAWERSGIPERRERRPG